MLFFSTTMGQNGPGGVGNTDGSSALELWLIPESMKNSGGLTPSNGETIYQWNDMSGNNSHAYYLQNNTASQKGKGVYVTNSVNSYASFDGQDLNRNFRTTNYVNGRSIFVANTPGSHNFIGGLVGFEGDKGIRRTKTNPNQWQAIGAEENNDDAWSGTQGNSFIDGASGYTHNQKFHILTQLRKINNGGTNVNNRFFLGGYYAYYWYGWDVREFNGSMSEVIVFSDQITLAERIIIENYLSAKYGSELASNGNGFYKMDKSSNGNFDFHVAGIGKASDGSSHLHSKGTGIVSMKNPSSISNNEFIFWGADTKNIHDYHFNYNSMNFSYRLSNTWRVDKKNDVGNVDIAFEMTDIDMETIDSDCNDFKLIVSSSESFGTYVSYPLTQNGTEWSASGVSFSDGDYFTLEYLPMIGWNGYAYKNGSGTNEAPSMVDGCKRLMIDSQNSSGMTAILSENAEVKELVVKEGNTLVIEDGIALFIEDGMQLDGDIRLLGDAQIIQKHSESSKVTGEGKMYRQRKSLHPTKYTVQYLSSPVSSETGDKHDVTDVIHVGGNYDELIYGGYQGVTANSNHSEYTYVESPFDAGTAPLQLSNYWLWRFVDGSSYNDWEFIRDEFVKVKAGEGFSIKGTGRDETYVFIGKPNDGIYTTTISPNNESVLGNPYPSAFDSNKFILDNINVIKNGTLHFWDHVSATYHGIEDYSGGFATLNLLTGVKAIHINTGEELIGAKTPQRYLPVGQGFIVLGSTSGGTITFDNSQRVHKTEETSESFLLRTTNNQESQVSILKMSFGHFTENNQLGLRQIAAGFKEGLTTDHENGYDSEMIDEQETDIFWKFQGNDRKYVIIGVSEFHVDHELPLAVKTERDGIHTFKIDELINIDAKVFLKDRATSLTHELSDIPFEYFIEKGYHDNRFSIVFEPQEGLDIAEDNLNEIKVFYSNLTNEIVIQTKNETIEQVSMFNLLGQSIINKKVESLKTEYKVPIQETISEGVYLINVKTEKGIKSIKIKI